MIKMLKAQFSPWEYFRLLSSLLRFLFHLVPEKNPLIKDNFSLLKTRVSLFSEKVFTMLYKL